MKHLRIRLAALFLAGLLCMSCGGHRGPVTTAPERADGQISDPSPGQADPAAAPSDGGDATADGEEAAEEPTSPWEESRHMLRFDENGEFRILVFSDIHAGANGVSDLAKTNIALLVEREDPDFVFFDGDNTWGITSATVLRKSVEEMTKVLEEKQIPWAHVYGNHDAENNNVDKEKQQQIYESFPYCVSQAGEPDLPGVGNYVLPVYASDGSRVRFNIWALDSGQYITAKERASYLPVTGIFQGYLNSVYDYIRPSQIGWYMRKSAQIEQYCGEKIPGLMAFHIPLQESYLAWMNRDALTWTGEKREAVCASEINSGLYAALAERGDVKAVVNGHDHVNDYMVEFGGIKLCYCSTVSETGYCNMDMLGARVFLIREEDPSDIETWMSYVDEARMHEVSAPADAEPLPDGAVLLDFDAYEPEMTWCGWDNNESANAQVENMIVEIVPDKGRDGTKALAVSRKNFSSDVVANNAEVKITLDQPGLLGGARYLRVWMDLTGDTAKIDFRKACFGLIENGQLLMPYRTDDKDTPTPFYYLPEGGTEWQTMSHGGDGCFGNAQDSSVLGFKGWFAFPVENMLRRSTLVELKGSSYITGVYFYYCLASSSMKDNLVYLDDFTLTEDYTVFD